MMTSSTTKIRRGIFSEEQINNALSNIKAWGEESDRLPNEQYSYHYPEYPQTLSVKNQFIADELLSSKNYGALPDEVVDRILALPKDEAAEDISKVVFYVIGKTYQGVNDNNIDNPMDDAIMHALLLFAQLRSEKGLDAVLEILRQNGEFADYHLGDFAPEFIHPALYACSMNNVKAIEDYLYQPGLDSYVRSQALDALAMIIYNHPERRDEIIDVFRRLLVSMVTRLPRREACDGRFAGSVMCTLIEIQAKELIPEIEAVFATDCVQTFIAGKRDKVIEEINAGSGAINPDKYFIQDIHEQYQMLK